MAVFVDKHIFILNISTKMAVFMEKFGLNAGFSIRWAIFVDKFYILVSRSNSCAILRVRLRRVN